MPELNIFLSAELHQEFQELAASEGQGGEAFAARVIERYLSLQRNQLAEISQAIEEADGGDFVEDAEIARILAKYQ